MDANTAGFSLLNGHYKAQGNWYTYLTINGPRGVMKDSSGAELETKITLGNFGEVDPDIFKETGQKFYNFQLEYNFGKDMAEEVFSARMG